MKSKPNRSPPLRHRGSAPATRFGLARVLNKLGVCSRTQAQALVRAGRVRVDGRIVRDPETPADARSRIEVDGASVAAVDKIYLALNKPRGYVTTARDEHGRDTVYALLRDAGLHDSVPAHDNLAGADRIGPDAHWLAPVGRLDKASEGLLLFTNDSAWAARLTDPATHLDKVYHVQIDALPDADLLQRMQAGIDHDGQRLAAKAVRELRRGDKNAWLEITLDEGRNRQIRRMLAAFDIAVLRLVRVAIGPLALGDLPKGAVRALRPDEVNALSLAGQHTASPAARA
jgi:23S rRNA pseudouridine2605 synthase